MREFARDLRRVTVMNEVLQPGNKMTPKNVRTLRADAIVQVALDEKYLSENMAAATVVENYC